MQKPVGFDLIGWVEGTQHMIAACRYDPPWLGTAVPYKAAAGPIADEMMQVFPEIFDDKKKAELWFLFEHMRFMSNKCNDGGLPYPIALEAPSVATLTKKGDNENTN